MKLTKETKMITTYDNGLFTVAKISNDTGLTVAKYMTTGVWGVYNVDGKLIVTQGMRKTAINVANQLAEEKFCGC